MKGDGGAMRGMESWPTGRLLVVAARLAQQAFQDFLDAHGVTMAGLHVLMVLNAGPRPQVEVATACGVRSQTIGRTIDRLVRHGMVTRRRDATDRRRRMVDLTDRGRDLAATVSTEGARRSSRLGPSFFEQLEDPQRFRADLIQLVRHLWAAQAADRAAQWAEHAGRWAAFDASPIDRGPDGPPGPRIPPRPPAFTAAESARPTTPGGRSDRDDPDDVTNLEESPA